MSNRFDAAATLNEELSTWLQSEQLPHWMPDFPVVYNIPETGIVTPCISVTHIPISSRWYGHSFVGTGNGLQAESIMEINVWVSRSSPDHMAVIELVSSLIEQHYAGIPSLALLTFKETPSFGMPTPFKINIDTVGMISIAEDLNPDIERRRIQVRYSFTVREL